ncbi:MULTISPECIES: alpha/beta hydrolase [Clostridium]|uniref:alpha/beta hydrolase n=1 Tax=Clostridium TaxID=1485 RepID=UPI000826B1BE|nr:MULTISPECIES: alpha/beta hydrolase [Clostridium]PJI10496.1 alpha/beta hydrolase [Clostridium sp. CT7]
MKKITKKVLIPLVLLVIVLSAFIISLYKRNTTKLDTYISLCLHLNNIINPTSITNKSIKKIRGNLNTQSTKWSKKAIPFSDIKNFTIRENLEEIPVRIYTPKSGSNMPIIIYSHAGFWAAGNLDTEDNICRKLSLGTNAVLVSVDYRLAPENPFPSAVNDVYNVLQWTYKNASTINGDGKRIALVGDSAGGNLSAAVSLMARNKNGPPITCQVLIYPSTNIFKLNSKSWSLFAKGVNINSKDMQKYISLYIPKKEDRKNPYASPLLAKNFEQLPDAFIITAEIDPLSDEGKAYGEKLKAAGVKVDFKQYNGVCHGFIQMDKITPKADKALNEITLYLKKEFHEYK